MAKWFFGSCLPHFSQLSAYIVLFLVLYMHLEDKLHLTNIIKLKSCLVCGIWGLQEAYDLRVDGRRPWAGDLQIFFHRILTTNLWDTTCPHLACEGAEAHQTLGPRRAVRGQMEASAQSPTFQFAHRDTHLTATSHMKEVAGGPWATWVRTAQGHVHVGVFPWIYWRFSLEIYSSLKKRLFL